MGLSQDRARVGGETVDSLLARIAAAGPDAGGGVAGALTAATSAALVAMVGGIAARHAPDDAALGDLVGDAEGLRGRLTDLIELDATVYRRVLEARRQPEAIRSAALRDALIGATEVPLEVASASCRLLEHCVALLSLARPSTLADLGVAGLLAAAALEAAALTARVNLRALQDPDFVAEAGRRLEESRQHGRVLHARLSQTIADRIAPARR